MVAFRAFPAASSDNGEGGRDGGGQAGGSTVSADLIQIITDLKIVNQQEADATKHGNFFNRKAEVSQLLHILEGQPSRITVLVGPIDSGKSKLLDHLRSVWNQKAGLNVFSPVLFIDMRKCDCTSPDGLAKSIRIEVESWKDSMKSLFNAMQGEGSICGIPVGSITGVLSSFWDSFEKENGLVAVQDSIRFLLDRNPNIRPIIIFDEANRLTAWKDDYPVALASLAHFLLWITKQTCKGHVIMASSDDFFCTWVGSVLGLTKIKVVPVGYFSEREARAFLLNYAIPHQKLAVPPVDDNVWMSIHKVTGGSPHLLIILAQDAADYESWDLATEAMMEPMVNFWEDVLATNKAGTRKELEGMMKIISRNGGLAGYHEVMREVFDNNGMRAKEIVKQLVKDNIFHVRVWYAGMRYYDLQKASNDSEFLMATTPAAFAAMKSLYPPPSSNS